MAKIDKFEGEFAFLSNFYDAEVEYEGIKYPTNEHAFQAAKSLNPARRLEIAMLDTPGKAKRAGRNLQLRHDWEKVKYDVMLDIVFAKFHQHPELATKLLATGDAELIEGNWWNDTTWGVCNGVGSNWLGRILMMVRARLYLEAQLEADLNE
jgi:ribA/ribD-fused uncharacterized protein